MGKRVPCHAYIPKPSKHLSGQAVVRISGQDVYVGRYGSAETQNRYDAVVGEWLARGRTLPPPQTGQPVHEVLLTYWQHAEAYYRKPDSRPTSELHCIRAALRPVRALYGDSDADAFDSLALQAVVRRMIGDGLSGPFHK